jgi:hypothetical protein
MPARQGRARCAAIALGRRSGLAVTPTPLNCHIAIADFN